MHPNTNGSGNERYTKDLHLAYTDRAPTPEETMRAGEEVARLLNSPQFNLAYQSAITLVQNEWAQSEAHESKKRDALYHMLQALPRVMWVLRDTVSAAESVAAERMREEELAQYDSRARYRPPEGAQLP